MNVKLMGYPDEVEITSNTIAKTLPLIAFCIILFSYVLHTFYFSYFK